jgi:hypothetical protein
MALMFDVQQAFRSPSGFAEHDGSIGTEHYMEIVSAVIRSEGFFVGTAKALESGLRPTKLTAVMVYERDEADPHVQGGLSDQDGMLNSMIYQYTEGTLITPDDVAQAAAVRAWAATITEGNEYLRNVSAALGGAMIPQRGLGIAASAFVAHKRALGELAEQQAYEKKVARSAYLGTVGEKLDIEVTCEKVIGLENEWGTTRLHIFKADHNELIWFCSGSWWAVEGDTLTIRGTVKGHRERDGMKQTVLSRVREVVAKL